jgi:hypothetical protein
MKEHKVPKKEAAAPSMRYARTRGLMGDEVEYKSSKLSPEIEEQIDWAFHPMTYNEDPNIRDPLIYVVVKDNFDEIEEMGFAADLRSIVMQGRGGFDERTILGVYSDLEQAKAKVRQLIRAKGLDKKPAVRESILSSNDRDVRDSKELAAQALLYGEDGVDEIDLDSVDEETLDQLLQRLTITEENVDRTACEIISVMRETNASENEILEALAVHMNLHLNEAKELYEDNK